MNKVAICIATCNRNQLLRACLESLHAATAARPEYQVAFMVIDNNATPLAHQVLGDFDGRTQCCWEPRPGIPFARNRALQCAREWGADFIAFIDDDETVDPDWFSQIMPCIDRPGVDVVSGRVLQEIAGHERPKDKGCALQRDRAETDNVIFKAWLAERLQFDESLAQCGGSDTLFFRQAHALGAIIHLCNAAVARESMPAERDTLAWHMRRHFRYGLVHCRIERRLEQGASRSALLLRALLLIPLGLLEMLLARLLHRGPRWRSGLLRSMRGLGGLAYFLGLRYDEYRRAPSTSASRQEGAGEG